MEIIGLDFETHYKKPTVKDPGYSVQTLGNWAYTHDPRFDAYLVTAYDGEVALAASPEEFDWECLEGCFLVSHNAAFDQAVYERLVELGKVPRVKFAGWGCSANLSVYIANHRALKNAAKYLLGKEVSKAERDAMNGKQWADVVRDNPEQAKALIEYAKQDVINCRELWVRYASQWPEHEQQVADLTIEQGRYGVAIDTQLLEEGLAKTKIALKKIEDLLPWVGEGEKPTSTKAVQEACIQAGIPLPPVKDRDGEEAFDEWENNFKDKYVWVSAVGQWRSVNKVLGTLETIKSRLKPDGTIDFSLLYFGGHTGRWSGGGSGLNMQNLRKDPLLFDTHGFYVYTEERLKEYADHIDPKKQAPRPSWLGFELSMRALFIPRPGKKFIICDASQIEPRCLNWLAGNHELLAKIAEGYSYYEAYAMTFEGWTGEKGSLKKSLGDAGYTRLKNKCLGLGYGMGAVKYTDYAGVTIEEAQKVVAGFRAENPLIADPDKGIWARLERGFKASAANVRQPVQDTNIYEVELPSGRCMRYRKVKQEWRTKRGYDGKPVQKVVYTAEIAGNYGPQRFELYGGLLTENLVQATARDVFAYHILKLTEAGHRVIFHSHDEVIVEAALETDPKEVEKIMSCPPPWLPGCPLAAEAKEATHYKK